MHVAVAGINRRDALIDVGFSHSRDAQFARHQAHSRREARQARLHLRGEHGFQFVRRARKQNHDASARFEPKPGRGPASVLEDGRAFRHHRLAGVHFGHRAPKLPEARFDLAHDGGIPREFAPEQIGHGFARAVILGGTKAAARNHQFDALHRARECVAQGSEFVADHRLTRDFDAQTIELRGKKKGIGVDPVRGEEFRSDCDDFSFHGWVSAAAAALRLPNRG